MSNGKQIEGWAINRELPTLIGNEAWGFFTDRAVAEQEAARFNTFLHPARVVPATLVLPPDAE